MRALRGLARARLEQGQLDAALATFDALESLDPGYLHVTAGRDHARALAAGAEERLARSPPDATVALARADRLAATYPDTPGTARLRSRALEALGDADRAAGDRAAAEARYRAAIRTDPDRLPPILSLGELLLGAGRVDDAVRVLTLGLRDHPDDPRVQRLMVDALTRVP